MNNLQVIRDVECFVDENGIIQLKLEDVARGLGFTTVAKSGNDVIRWARVQYYLQGFGFSQDVGKDAFIPEPIFYLLAMKADSEVAREFQKKVAYEVLPEIRKHGMYATQELLDNPDLLIKVATALKEERERNKLLEKENMEQRQLIGVMQPKVDFFNDVASSKSAIAIGDVAKVLGIKGLGRNNLFELLREKKVLMPDNKPYQKYIDNGYFRVIEQKYQKPGSEVVITFKTLVYQKGVDFIRKLVEHEPSQV